MNMELTLATRYLWGRKLRTVLTTLAIVFGVMIIFGMNGMVPAIQAAFGENMTMSAHSVDLVLTHETGGTFPAERAEIVASTPGVAAITPVLERAMLLPSDLALPADNGTLDRITVNGWEPSSTAQTLPFQAEEGRWLTAEDANAVMVRRSFVEATGLGLGDSVDLPTAAGVRTFEIVGILQSRPVLGDEELFMLLAAAQDVFNLPGQINAIAGQFDEGADGDAVRAAILERLGPGFQAGSVEAGGSEWETAMQMANLVFTLFGVLALAMGGFIMFNTKNNKATVFVAVEPKSGLSVKGSTIMGFDSAKFFEKTVRKPEDFVKNADGCRKSFTAAVRYLNGVKTKAGVPTGRVNKHCLILQVQY
jgi:putative ABC transport system permease protein